MRYITKYLKYCFVTFSAVLLALPAISFVTAQEPQLHPLESYYVKYKSVGNSTGEKTQFFKDYGRTVCMKETAEITMPEVGTVKRNEKIVSWIEGDEMSVVTINLTDNTGTKIKDPRYPQMKEMLKDKDPKELNKELMTNNGGSITGQKTINGEKCDVWSFAQGSLCITEDLILLETVANMDNISIKETAVEVKRNASEPDNICDISGAKITEMSVEDLMKQHPQGN